ncbi:hypothetical protein EPA93_03795 [Ktedonosporobacter rubrisoli]|uniref:Uncharacterized protein n=1 Tax=Ktedonosporobacter rubrisoli TaxID=2509675 RepID=A0A4P6JJP4_KTERU|nr:hypothetical protein [Ktedonosporobacter rubrisoli]QBD75162.1 hypothetical protein EPA93_03795 [Ktedonosporobacter rubrisoli]
MKTGPSPQWLKITEMPRVAWMIDGMLEAAEEVYGSLQQAREKPHVMDDLAINRVYEVHGSQLEDLWLYEEQLRRFEKEMTSADQGKEIDRLTAQLVKLRGVLAASLKLADEIREGTLNRIMEMDDGQLAIEVMQGKRKPPV